MNNLWRWIMNDLLHRGGDCPQRSLQRNHRERPSLSWRRWRGRTQVSPSRLRITFDLHCLKSCFLAMEIRFWKDEETTTTAIFDMFQTFVFGKIGIKLLVCQTLSKVCDLKVSARDGWKQVCGFKKAEWNCTEFADSSDQVNKLNKMQQRASMQC